MLLSILTVSLNSEKHILECLESTRVLCQRNDVEHILVDGGSVDGTLDLASKRGHVDVRRIKDTGVYDAMNQAIQFASGKYTLFLNSDDSCLLSDIDFLNTDELWYTGLIEYIDYNGELIRRDRPYKFSVERLLISNIIRHPATFVKTSFMREFKFNLKYKYAADYDFFLRISRVSNPIQLNLYCSRFRIWHGGLSSGFVHSLNDELRVRLDWRILCNRQYLIPLDIIVYLLRLLKIYVNSIR